jgi:hypothetical protein
MFGSFLTRLRSEVSMARPVASPEWMMRGSECAPSCVRSSSPEKQFLDDARPFDGEEADSLLVRKAGAGSEDVLDQLRGRVAFAFVNDPPLCPEGVAVLRIGGFGDEEDFDPRARQAKRRREPGDTGADDEDGIVVAVLQRRHAAHCSGEWPVVSGQWSVKTRRCFS